jgi:hypothetical protein
VLSHPKKYNLTSLLFLCRFSQKTVNGIEILSLQGGSAATTFTKPEIEVSTYNIKVENGLRVKLFLDVACLHKDDQNIQKPNTYTVTHRYDWNNDMDKTETKEFVLENCEDTPDSDYQAYVKAASTKDRKYNVYVCPGMHGWDGEKDGCTLDWVNLREMYGTTRLTFNRRSGLDDYKLYFIE